MVDYRVLLTNILYRIREERDGAIRQSATEQNDVERNWLEGISAGLDMANEVFVAEFMKSMEN